MARYLVNVYVCRQTGVVEQLPVFTLDGDTHSLFSEKEAEEFAEEMFRNVIEATAGLATYAMEEP